MVEEISSREHINANNKNIILQEGLSEPECYGDVVYKFRKIVGTSRKRAYIVLTPSNPTFIK